MEGILRGAGQRRSNNDNVEFNHFINADSIAVDRRIRLAVCTGALQGHHQRECLVDFLDYLCIVVVPMGSV